MPRIVIQHDAATWAARSAVDPPENPRDRPIDGYRDDWAIELAEALWLVIQDLPEAIDVEGIDLQDPNGVYLYTLQGEAK